MNFLKAIRENVGLLVGFAGGTGSGKTYSALRLATGLCPTGKKIAVIDTEAGRAKHYAADFTFDHADLRPPFRPGAYAEAIIQADKLGYPVIVVDSMSHEHAGDGGLLDWHEEELARMAGDDWKRRESCNMAAWIKPKVEHKHMIARLLQVRAHLILCFRAEEKVEMVRDNDGKWKIQPKQSVVGLDGWIPVCEKNVPYELTCSFLFLAATPGMPRPIKLPEWAKTLFPRDQVVSEETGKRLAAWANGGKPAAAPASAPPSEEKALVTELWNLLKPVRGPKVTGTISEAWKVANDWLWREELLDPAIPELAPELSAARFREVIAKLKEMPVPR